MRRWRCDRSLLIFDGGRSLYFVGGKGRSLVVDIWLGAIALFCGREGVIVGCWFWFGAILYFVKTKIWALASGLLELLCEINFQAFIIAWLAFFDASNFSFRLKDFFFAVLWSLDGLVTELFKLLSLVFLVIANSTPLHRIFLHCIKTGVYIFPC